MPSGFTNLPLFRAALAFAPSDLEADLVKRHKKLALEAGRRIVKRTPVDTGRARGNWQAQIGRPARREVETRDRNGGKTIRQIAAKAAAIEAFDVFWLSNSVPYIGVLENGSSTRAGRHFVKRSLNELGLLPL